MRLVKFISLLILLFSIVEEKQSQCSNFTVNAGLSADLVTETLYSEDFWVVHNLEQKDHKKPTQNLL